jgi:hypothetical protein
VHCTLGWFEAPLPSWARTKKDNNVELRAKRYPILAEARCAEYSSVFIVVEAVRAQLGCFASLKTPVGKHRRGRPSKSPLGENARSAGPKRTQTAERGLCDLLAASRSAPRRNISSSFPSTEVESPNRGNTTPHAWQHKLCVHHCLGRSLCFL